MWKNGPTRCEKPVAARISPASSGVEEDVGMWTGATWMREPMWIGVEKPEAVHHFSTSPVENS